ncbi:hypothetical protein C882_2633 [Caenispirillum salinarum AK4]|uniref:SMODS and SLOG-associating 2TM effector domain-containing protein n=1 Tax=Caenispirillum salinarum AK4 TaxID=1238182 RepID=K9H641_9PROT|nr:hypothetical protein [Caenispirillum salinarum]EKV32554.1 hypothetical protein C882_2633 [Caenispirillum salinarum AK4]
MTPSRLRYETYRDLYQSERARRDEIRGGVGTPVAALAFSVYSLAAVAANFDAGTWSSATGIAILVLAGLAVLTLVAGAVMIVRVEMDFVYLDPPDLRELVAAEKRLRAHDSQDDQRVTDDRVVAQLHDLLAAAYDIAYRRYFAGNEQAARDRTRGLRLLIVALATLSLALAVLPFHNGGGTP